MKEDKFGRKEIKEVVGESMEYRTSSDISDYPNHIKINNLILDLVKMKNDGATHIEFEAWGGRDGEVDDITVTPYKLSMETESQAIARNVKAEKDQAERVKTLGVEEIGMMEALILKYPEYNVLEFLTKIGKK